MHFKEIFILCIILVKCSNLKASDIFLKFYKITFEDGLNENRFNNYIFQDSRGLVWMSSLNGLYRYDGMTIKTYHIDSGLKGTNIQSNFFEDENGDLWFSTYEAINRYDARLDSFINYQVTNFNNELVTKNYRVFHLDKEDNKLWLATNKHIYWLNTDCPEEFQSLPIKTEAHIFNVGVDEKGRLNHIVTKINKDSIAFIYPFNNENSREYQVLSKFKSIHLNNSKWLFFHKKNMTLFDEKLPAKRVSLKNGRNVSISDIFHYSDKLFISTKENGIWLYNLNKEKFINHWEFTEKDKSSLLTNRPRNLYISPSNYLWCSHRNKGVNFSYLYNNNFKNPLADFVENEVDVTSILETGVGNIWVSTKYNGVFVFNQAGLNIHTFKHPVKKILNSGLLQICRNKNDKVFAITSRAIFELDLKNRLTKTVIARSDSLIFKCMNIISPNRHLVSSNNGVLEIVKKNSEYEIQTFQNFLKYNELNFLQMYQTLNNRVFIPYGANELWIYEATRDGLKLIAKNDSCRLQFFGFCESRKQPGIVWAGTSKGLKTIDHNNLIKPVFNRNSELSKGNVYSIVEDKNGLLWLTTGKGLWRYDPVAKTKPVHFEEADGLSGELFSLYHSALYTSNGTIWMGNNKGLVVFHPDSIKVHKEVPKLHLEELIVNDTKSFRKSINTDNIIELNYDRNTLTFDIRAVNLYKTEKNKIHYFLECYDDDTLQISNGEKIRYTKIKPGEYNLKAQAEDANGHKGDFKQLLTINIKPPFWQTWWFYALCAMLTLLFSYLIYRVRVNYILREEAKKREIEKLEAQVLLEAETKKREIAQIKAQAQIEEAAKKTELEKLKNQVLEVEMKVFRAQMNPHFLFNSLNSIKSLILKTKEKEAAAYLSKFSTLLRSILNNSEKQKIKLSEEIEALRLYIELESLRFDSDFNYQIQIDKNIDSSFIRIPPLILQPFVENAIWWGLLPKTSGSLKLNINIIRNNDFLFFEIEDNGVGRKKASTLPEKHNQKSMGIKITKKRIQLLHPKNNVEIFDLVDDRQEALGTKVVIRLFAPE